MPTHYTQNTQPHTIFYTIIYFKLIEFSEHFKNNKRIETDIGIPAHNHNNKFSRKEQKTNASNYNNKNNTFA